MKHFLKNFLKNNARSLLIIALCVIWALWDWDSIPNQVPTHFDASGHPDEFKDRDSFWFALPLVTFLSVVINSFMIRFLHREELEDSQKTMGVLNLGLTFLLMSVFVGIILEAKTGLHDIFSRVLFFGVGLFMIQLGLFFSRLKKNYILGIRVPWTLNSSLNWQKTHHFSGKVFILAGACVFLTAFFDTPPWLPIGFLILASLISVLFSLVYFLKYERSLSSGAKSQQSLP